MKFVIIGITDNPRPWFPPEVMDIIKNGRVFSGGKRHHEIVTPLLPEDAEWIDITVPLNAVFKQYSSLSSLPIIVFASGDPLFFGFANTVQREFKGVEVKVYPSFNSLQMLAHRMCLPYHDMRIVSLTGRPWSEFDRALIERATKIGILTDKEHTPASIARRMLEYGYTYYTMHVGEHLGNPNLETVTTLSLEEARQSDFGFPNCVILNTSHHELNTNLSPTEINDNSWQIHGNSCINKKTAVPVQKPFGIPDQSFTLLEAREKMITKMPIRLLTLQALELPRRRVLWDIGFCTGSVSIEARLQFPHLRIEAFEIRTECEALIDENARKFGAPGINVHIGDFLQGDISRLPAPDAVFIGGHGGKLKEIMAKVRTVITKGGCIVMNSVKAPKVLTDSHRLWDEACHELELTQEPPTRIILNDNHPIEILKATV